MGWFADSMRLRDVIQVVTSIEIPLPESSNLDNNEGEGDLHNGEPPMTA